MVTFGRGDANFAARDAWLQVPLHLALALGVAAAGPVGPANVAWKASLLATLALALWAAMLLSSDLSSLGDYADLLDVFVAAALLALYAAASTLLWRPATDSSDTLALNRE